MKLNRIFLLLIVMFAPALYASAQDFKVQVKADTNKALIGDRIRVSYNIEVASKALVKLPVFPDSIGKLEIAGMQPDTVYKKTKKLLQLNLDVTSFDTGAYVIPAQLFEYQSPGSDSLAKAYSDSVYLKFVTVPVDTAKPFKDIKGPLDVDYSLFWERFFYALLVLGVIAAGVFLYLYLKKRKKAQPEEPEYDPKIPSHVIALEALRRLESEKLWQKGQTKLYYTKMIDIIRKYIERRFRFNAMEMTSSEIAEELKKRGYPEEKISPLREAMALADLAKFAKMEPLPDENDKAMRLCVQFVELSIPTPLPQANDREEGEPAHE